MAKQRREAVHFRSGYYVRSLAPESFYVFEDGRNRVGPYLTEGEANQALNNLAVREAARKRENRRLYGGDATVTAAKTTTTDKPATKPAAAKKEKTPKADKVAKAEKTPRAAKVVKKSSLGHVLAKEGVKTTHRVAGKRPLTAVCGSRNVASAKEPILLDEIPEGKFPCWKCERDA